jgi:NAD(P)-dependent dehydrogenase (short-subunit alcohol dehydrogenase family)
MMAERIRDAVVVITGASSGIGRATALAFAEQGARVVLAARGAEALAEVADECQRRIGQALSVPTDVTDEAAVRALARRAIERFGGIDIWVNNAGVYLVGRFEEVPAEAFRGVIETNLFGYAYGLRAVLPHFRDRGRGTVINTLSLEGKVSGALNSAYAASKFALVGLLDAVRQELADAPNIHICAVLPASVNTPLFAHAGNYGRWGVRPVPPIYEPETVARAIVGCAERPSREVYVGGIVPVSIVGHALAPGLTDRALGWWAERTQYTREPAAPSLGNLAMPSADAQIHGGWPATRGMTLSRRAMGLLATLPVLAAMTVGVAWLGARRATASLRNGR